MRAVLLLFLGGGLLWFVWRSLDAGKSAEEEAHAASPGTMLAPEPAPLPGNVEVAKTPERQAEKPPERAVQRPVDAPVPPAPTGPVRPAREEHIPPPASAVELELAREMLKSPSTFSASVAEKGASLAPGRKQLALALAKALGGAEAEARTLADALDGDMDVRASEREFVKRVVEHKSNAPQLAAAEAATPLVLAATLVLESREAEAAAKSGRWADAARRYSALLLQGVNAGWRADPEVLGPWSEALRAVQKRHRWSKSGDWPSIQVTVQDKDTLIAIRKRMLQEHADLLLYTGQIERANELSGGVIHAGQVLRIPTDKAHMLVDLDAHWAFYMLGSEVAAAWPVGIGRDGSETKVGTYTAGERTKEPMWFPPGRAPVPFGDPENPLGTRWIAWLSNDSTSGSGPRLGFHGTKDPMSIGKDLSQGCIRMRNEDVEELFEILPKGAEIVVQP